ncbi:tRNA 5-carboxymethoxyuridine methyltransferase [Austwickia sp. TVS 96-490-7B]|uniref:class I SAM-dependent methyltransferase n=1 Tax=Austwickia sp. TVS 96-490-7B TaxID=2830843 RepID=UPI001C589971|nr:class I SAM-dependent methyltransferase [Austwickia sp. TVS 96-490-7B]MBW3084020.1 tRNA 5-carboxymethoxyuridine methyltransferase [Austwickia sp. TVS 96-490-7B]
MDAHDWDERYAAGRVWSVEPNRWVVSELSGVTPGRALDAACGEGRNALWLAEQGWQVDAVDYSQVALQRGRQVEAECRAAGQTDSSPISWIHADLTEEGTVAGHYDLVLAAYVQIEAFERTPLIRAAAATLAPGGTLLVVAHDTSNLTDGWGGPQDPAHLYTARDIASDVQDMISSGALAVERADRVAREVDTEEGPRVAWDALFRAHRRDSTKGLTFV